MFNSSSRRLHGFDIDEFITDNYPMTKTRLMIILAAVGAVIIAGFLILFSYNLKPKMPVIGILNYAKAAESSVIGFKDGLKSLGYVEGENIKIIYNGLITDEKALEKEAERFCSLPVDIIISMSSAATLTAQKSVEGTGIPIIFGPVSNPIEVGIIKDLRHEGENITGVTFGLQEDKRLEILTKISPGIKRVFMLYNFTDISPVNSLKKLEQARTVLDLEFIRADVRHHSEIKTAMQNMPDDIDAVFIPTDRTMAANVGEIAGYATARGLISSSPHRDGVKEGALYSFSFDLIELGKEISRLTDQVIKGTPAEDLPVEVSEFFLSINLTTAKQLNLQIPEDLMRTATLYQ